jgi:predicted NodU family carbamoyl transferase
MSTERITRYKHDTPPPIPVIKELIREFEINPSAIRHVVVRELERYSHLPNLSKVKLLMASPAGRKHLIREMLGDDKFISFQSMVATEVNRLFPRAAEVRAFDHHLAHATSAHILSGFTDPLNITLDGWGDGVFSKAFVRDGSGLKQVSASKAISVRKSEERLRLMDRFHHTSSPLESLTTFHLVTFIPSLLGCLASNR